MARGFSIDKRGGEYVASVAIRGRDILRTPLLNQGTGFSAQAREQLGLVGLLPPQVLTMRAQLDRVYTQLHRQPTDLAKYVFMNDMLDRNETLFYRLISEHIEELLPIIYTPTVGEAIQEFSQWFLRPRGVFLDIDHPEAIEDALKAHGRSADEIDIIVATDSEGILGIGDQGVGGVMIAVGKLSVYTAAAGIHPHRMLPVVLDTGTNNEDLLADPGYLGVRHARVRGERYDKFIRAYAETAHRLFPNAMLHWEDFGAANAHRVLATYRDDYCTFNDDIEGTAAVVVAAVLSALATLGERLSDQRIVVFGAGTAGIGIADMLIDLMVDEGLTRPEAYRRFWALNSAGLISSDHDRIRDFQRPYARDAADLDGWRTVDDDAGGFGLAGVVHNVHPTILIGTSAQPDTFTKAIIEDMAAHTSRPIVLALSNPTSRTEAAPEDIVAWTRGKALIASGSPFDPVVYGGVTFEVAQANNSLIFPGFGLGCCACRPVRITDSMVAATAKAVAAAATDRSVGASLLPGVNALRRISAKVAEAFVRQAVAEGLAGVELYEALAAIPDNMWEPVYPRIELVDAVCG
ncbi:MAG: NAD-dependent malic enzyme [Micrococcales bacterium]|nr:NAD-dependent malic enzyme [Micrococcales bacterium]